MNAIVPGGQGAGYSAFLFHQGTRLLVHGKRSLKNWPSMA